MGVKLNPSNKKILLVASFILPLVTARYILVKMPLTKEILIYRAIVELLILPIYLYALYIVLTHEIIGDLTPKDQLIINLLVVLGMVGYGAHFSADLLDIVQTRVNPYDVNMSDPYQRIQVFAYFLDEIISHKFMFYPLLIFLFYLLIRERKIEMTWKDILFCVIGGLILGPMLMIGTIEGQSPYGTLVFSISVIIYYANRIRHGDNWRERNWGLLMLVTAVLALIVGIAWYLYFGSFISPTELRARGRWPFW